jgi:hypothetical protein
MSNGRQWFLEVQGSCRRELANLFKIKGPVKQGYTCPSMTKDEIWRFHWGMSIRRTKRNLNFNVELELEDRRHYRGPRPEFGRSHCRVSRGDLAIAVTVSTTTCLLVSRPTFIGQWSQQQQGISQRQNACPLGPHVAASRRLLVRLWHSTTLICLFKSVEIHHLIQRLAF